LVGLPYCSGGELYKLVKSGQVKNAEQIKFYAANVLLGLHALNQNGIYYKE
jgi:serine/threonine protein kinase